MNPQESLPTVSGPGRSIGVRQAIRFIALAIVTAVLVMLTGYLGGSLNRPAPMPVLDTLGGDFRLPSTLGHELDLRDLRGRPVLLNFGFTSCPDVCPTVLARLRAVMGDLEALEIDAQPLFVTVDPERDDLETLGSYVRYFHEDLIGLRGDSQALEAVADQYRVFVERQSADAEGRYTVAHNAHIYLIDAQGRVRATYGESTPVSVIVDGVRSLGHARWASGSIR